jgi:hypothetical protein
MKTLKSMLAGMVMLIVCATANATTKPINDKLTKDDVINIYIDAVAHGKMNDMEKVLDDNMKFNLKRGDNVSTMNKEQLLASLKDNSVDPSVKTSSTVTQADDQSATVTVDFKFDGYVRSDTITLANAGDWVITNVESSYK